MSIWKARRLFVICETGVVLLLVGLLYLVFQVPTQYVDAIVAANANEKTEETDGSDKTAEVSPEIFVRNLETDNPAAAASAKPAKAAVPTHAAGARWQGDVTRFLRLKGTFVGDKAEDSLAIIKWKEEDQELYGIGEAVEDGGGIRIAGVFNDRVDIEKDGKHMTVQVDTSNTTPAAASRGGQPSHRVSPKRDPRGSSRGPRASKNDNKKSNIRKYGPNKYALSKSDLEPYLEQPDRLFTEMSVRPQTKNGEPTGGYMLTGMKSNALLKKVGLRDGDVILKVNGQNPINLMNTISDPSVREIQVEYMRGGRIQRLHYAIED